MHGETMKLVSILVCYVCVQRRNPKVQVRKSNITSLLNVMLLLIERHVSAYSENIIRFYDCPPPTTPPLESTATGAKTETP